MDVRAEIACRHQDELSAQQGGTPFE